MRVLSCGKGAGHHARAKKCPPARSDRCGRGGHAEGSCAAPKRSLPGLVGEAVREVGTRPDLHIVLIAHEMAVMHALSTLAGTHVREDHRQSACFRGINEGCTGSMVRASTDRDRVGGAAFMIERATVNSTIRYFGDFRCHDSSRRWCPKPIFPAACS